MILQCPACATRYLVPDNAVGPEGRQVRCANCKHSWFAEGQDSPGHIDVVAPPKARPPEPEQPELPVQPREDREERVARPAPPIRADDDRDPFAHEPPFKPRRNPARMWTAIAVAIFLVLGSAIGALLYFGPDNVAAQFGFGEADVNSSLDVQLVRSPERRILSNGHQLLSITGRIVNMTDEEQPIPPIHAELRNAQGTVVYDWTIPAPQRVLPPREMVEFNSAEVDIPRNAEELNLQFAPSGG